MTATKHFSAFLFLLGSFMFMFPVNGIAAESAPIQLEVRDVMVSGFVGKQAIITSTVDSVTITKITVNRGNSDASGANQTLPKTLKFGEQYVFGVSNFLEIEVDTDKGPWVFKGKQ